MILTDPFLLITLHLSHIGFTDDLTFTIILLSVNSAIYMAVYIIQAQPCGFAYILILQ